MYENRHGRFTAVNPLLASGKSANPQTFNRLIYCGNSPLTCSNPLGLDWILEERVEKQRVKDGKKYKTVERKFLVPIFVDKSDADGIPRIEPGVYQDSSSGGYWALHPTADMQSQIFSSKADAQAVYDQWIKGTDENPRIELVIFESTLFSGGENSELKGPVGHVAWGVNNRTFSWDNTG